MALVYRAVLQDADGAITRSVESIFRNWLVEKHLVNDDFVLPAGLSAPLTGGESPAWLQHQQASAGGRGSQAGLHRIRLVEELPEGRWITSAVWHRPEPVQQVLDLNVRRGSEQLELVDNSSGHAGATGWVWLDLEHEPVGGRPLIRPGSPRLVRHLMAAGEAHDATLPLTAEALTITQGHARELVGYLRDPDRQVPVAVFAHDSQKLYDQDLLARRLARDLAGVAAVFVLQDAATTAALATLLPESFAVYGGALRTYLPGAGLDGDAPNRHRVLGRVSIAALGQRAFPAVKNQVLELSTQRPGPVDGLMLRRLAGPARDAVSTRHPAPPASDSIHWLATQVRRLRAIRGRPANEEVLVDLEQAQAALAVELDALIQRTDVQPDAASIAREALPREEVEALAAELRTSKLDRRLLDELLIEAGAELTTAAGFLTELRDDHDYLQLELAEAVRANESVRRRMRWLERQLSDAGARAAVIEEPNLVIPDAVAEVVQLARVHLRHIAIGPTDADAAELDVHPGASLYAAKTWDALLALDAYASARRQNLFVGSFYRWCQAPPTGESAISAAAVAMMESETVDDNPTLRAKRLFAVPPHVNPTGAIYMPAHIKVVKRGGPAPRLHFYDDCSGPSGLVHVGYVGPHLPTARFD